MFRLRRAIDVFLMKNGYNIDNLLKINGAEGAENFWVLGQILLRELRYLLASSYPPGVGGVVPRLLVSGSNVSTFIGIWVPMLVALSCGR